MTSETYCGLLAHELILRLVHVLQFAGTNSVYMSAAGVINEKKITSGGT